jgi:hypothetical protein
MKKSEVAKFTSNQVMVDLIDAKAIVAVTEYEPIPKVAVVADLDFKTKDELMKQIESIRNDATNLNSKELLWMSNVLATIANNFDHYLDDGTRCVRIYTAGVLYFQFNDSTAIAGSHTINIHYENIRAGIIEYKKHHPDQFVTQPVQPVQPTWYKYALGGSLLAASILGFWWLYQSNSGDSINQIRQIRYLIPHPKPEDINLPPPSGH